MRKKVTRRYDISDGQATMKDGAKFDANVEIAWGTEDEEYEGCRLTHQNVTGQTGNPNKSPNDPPAFLIRIFEEIDESAETMVGEPSVTFDEDGNINVEFNYIQFSSAPAVDLIVGTQTAPAPYASAILKSQIDTNDGTLRTIKRIYNGDRTLSDVSELRFGGKVIVRTIVAIGQIPPTPSGFTLVGPGVLHPDGREIYTYQFAASAGGGSPGTSGQISIDYTNSEGGTVSFNPASPNTALGITRATIRYVTPLSVTTNPIPTPSGFVLVGIEQTDDTGYRMWVGHYERADGLVINEKTISETGALVVYHRVAYGTAPTAPAATIGGTVTLFQDDTSQQDGYVRYERRWAEANGQSDYTVEGQSDGAVIYTVVTFSAAPAIPAYPGTGTAYNTRLQQKTNAGYVTNIAVWHKIPATQTFRKKINFTKPGSAVIGGSPIQLVYNEPVTMSLLAEIEVSYDESQITDAPFTVEAYATLYFTYTPTDTGITVSGTKALGGYLAGASGDSGTNSAFNGILCDSWSYQLGSSTPSSFSLDEKVLDVDNDPYLTDIDGTVVFRRTKVSYDFS